MDDFNKGQDTAGKPGQELRLPRQVPLTVRPEPSGQMPRSVPEIVVGLPAWKVPTNVSAPWPLPIVNVTSRPTSVGLTL